MSSVALALAVALSTPCAPSSRPWLAEVLYDPAGADAGHEFVELFNPDGAARPLAGLRLEAGDGAAPGRWTLRWTAGPGDSIAAGGRFVVGGGQVLPLPQAIAELELQNGPDAVRLVWPDGVIETLGWGAHEHPGYACGEPASDAASGQSLARTPDDAVSGSNALDFRPALPSPGRANQPARDVALLAGSLALFPVPAGPGEPLVARATIVASGRGALAGGEVRLEAVGVPLDTPDPAPAPFVLGESLLDRDLEPGDSAGVAIAAVAPPAGKWRVRVRAWLEGDEAPGNETDSLVLRSGAGPLALTEVQFHPADGEGEWLEVWNASQVPVELEGWTFADRSGTRGAAGALTLAPGEPALLVQDALALLARFPALDLRRLVVVRPWPSLNNSDAAGGTADAVALREPDGTPCVLREYSAAGVAAGVTLEWLDGAWAPSLARGGTPLAPPRVRPPLAGHLEVTPRRLAPGSATAQVRWELPWARARVALEAYDLSGRRAATLLPEVITSGRGERAVSLAGLPAGVFALVLRAREDGGAGTLVATRSVRVAEAR